MNSCQLCGAKSWGPIDPEITPGREGTSVYFLVGKDLAQYRRCDGCGAFAALAQLEPVAPPRGDPVAESLGVTDPFLSGIMKNMKEILPPVPRQAETRLERLLRAALSAPLSGYSAQQLVNYVLECEDLLIAAEASDRTKTVFKPDRLCALEAFAGRIESLTGKGGVLERGFAGESTFEVCQALDTLHTALRALTVDAEDIQAVRKGHGGLYNPYAVGGGPWLVLSWTTKENFVDWLYLRLCSLDSPGPVDKLHSTEIRRVAEQVAEHVLDPGSRPS